VDREDGDGDVQIGVFVVNCWEATHQLGHEQTEAAADLNPAALPSMGSLRSSNCDISYFRATLKLLMRSNAGMTFTWHAVTSRTVVPR
jgi:hypothetical protein